MLHRLADHCAELHRRHVHMMTVGIAVAASVGLYFILPILLLAKEIAMSTPVIHRFRVAYAQDIATTSPTINPAPAPTTGSGPCPAGQYLGKTETGEAQCMFGTAPSTGGTSGGQSQPTQPQQPVQTYPMPAGVKCQADEVYAKNDQGVLACVRVSGAAVKMQPQVFPGEAPEMDEEFVDPMEIKRALSDTKKMKAELKRYVTKLKKLPNTSDDLTRITEIQSAIAEFEKNLKSPSEDVSIRETLRDFYDNNYWEEIQIIRAKVELPTEITRFNKDFARVKKLVGNKTYIKLGFDMAALGTTLGEVGANIKNVQELYAAGDLESAMDAMQEIRDAGQPGEMYGVMTRTRDILQRTKSVRSKDIQAQITEIIQPVIEAFNDGEFREASMVLDQISQELMQLQNKLMRTTNMDEATNQRFEKLQQMVDEKLQNGNGFEDIKTDEVQP